MPATRDDDCDRPGLTVLYATETGTAQDVADRIARHCRHIRYQCRIFNVEDYPISEIVSEQFLVFVVATAGTGKEPRPMTPLWKMLLRADLPSDLFEDLHYAVFGLGDSAYEKFCWPAKKLSRRMDHLGATAICHRGEGDVQHSIGTDGALDPWIGTLTKSLLELCPLPPDIIAEPIPQPWPARVALKPASADGSSAIDDPLLGAPGYHDFTVERNDRITASDWNQDVRLFELRCEDDVSYVPGDVAVIHPEVQANDVNTLLENQGWSDIADELLDIEHTYRDQSLPPFIPRRTSLRTILTKYLDITAVPKRGFFDVVRHFTDDERERGKMDEFMTKEGTEDLYDYTSRVRRTIIEVLDDFRHVKIPKDYIFDVFPPLRPREFSIASSVLQYPREVHLCIAIVDYKTTLKRPRRGIATSYLSALRHGTKLRIGLKRGLLDLPEDPTVPVICVGPGTGIAPMRAVIQTRVENGIHSNTLYFGCRSATKDQHFADEWRRYVEQQSLIYRVACSRDGPEGVKRTYVQNLIEADSEQVWEIIGKRRGWLYISGSSNKMPAAVREAVAHAVHVAGGMDESAAQAYVAKMELDGRLFEECWS
ncbi:riboflavin synthase domain-like protein [Vararia minispora EC-137]|uniref:Riboflavin synthase domain-like protein n=1 Tax=Vararia minispora EC-137 TaxID=1314806 RepID=A0ACB8Q618_9AGAM|nr:riboflavin synthase domain-like protein [Vararia minispora EC-137]